jgi:hypothetical protein
MTAMPTADFTIADVLQWARTKPADEVYNFGSCGNCAFAQFLIASGHAQQPVVGGRIADKGLVWFDGKGGTHYAPTEIGEAVVGLPRNFGALADRLEALLPAEPLSDTWTKADAYLTDIEAVARERVSA